MHDRFMCIAIYNFGISLKHICFKFYLKSFLQISIWNHVRLRLFWFYRKQTCCMCESCFNVHFHFVVKYSLEKTDMNTCMCINFINPSSLPRRLPFYDRFFYTLNFNSSTKKFYLFTSILINCAVWFLFQAYTPVSICYRFNQGCNFNLDEDDFHLNRFSWKQLN